MKRPDMKSALERAASGGRKAAAEDDTGIAPSRKGKRQVAAFFDPAVGRALKMLAAERESTVQACMAEAINDLFAKHGKPPIA